MGVAQRGNGGFTANGYCVDGWRSDRAGGTQTVTRVAAAVGSGLGQNGAKWALESVVASQAAAGDYAMLSATVEDARTLAGKEVTLSLLASAGAGAPKIGVEVVQNFGAGGTPSATVFTAIQAVTISTTATRYTVTFTVPSVAGKVLGTDGNDFLQINFWLSAGANLAARASSIGIQNATINITDVQLEEGGPTAFERLSQAEQLAWCQRYFTRLTVDSANGRYGHGTASSNSGGSVTVDLPVPMRTVPTFSHSGAGNFIIYNGLVTPILTSLSPDAAGKRTYALVYTHGSATTGADAVSLCQNGTNTSFLDFSAEL